MEEASLKLTVDAGDAIQNMDAFTQSATAAANAVERLESAFSALAGALKTLDGAPHGGITFQMVGDIGHAEVKPVVNNELKPKYHSGNTSEVGHPLRVFLDGEEVPWVAACDPDLGYVLVPPPESGKFVPALVGGVIWQKLEGVVTLEAGGK